MSSPRLAARAIIVHEQRLLLVNAYAPGKGSALWCAPGGGIERHQSLPENLIREVHEETGLTIEVGHLGLVNEFHDPKRGFHQVELFYHCRLVSGTLDANWRDPEAVVHARRWFAPDELDGLHMRPQSLPSVAFAPGQLPHYDPLELIVP